MRLVLLVDRATNAGLQAAGSEIDVADDEGARMIAAGQARPVRRRKPERTVRSDVSEKAIK